MKGAQALADAGARLRAAGVDGGVGDARRLLAHALGVGPDRVTLVLGDDMEPAALARFEAAVAARIARQPVAQIIGWREFYGRRFKVTCDVLDPRPDTETLIDAALERPFTRVLDLGTGSGCILLTLLGERQEATGLAVDLSEAALAVAAANVAAQGLGARATLILSDWFAQVDGRFDLIVSNPPYIGASEVALLQPEVRDWEPLMALSPGGDGLEPYRVIAQQAGTFLTPGGRIIVEIGAGQGANVCAMFGLAGFGRVDVRSDLAGRDRVVVVQK